MIEIQTPPTEFPCNGCDSLEGPMDPVMGYCTACLAEAEAATAAAALGDVWCSKCDAPATDELAVTDGSRTYTAAYCTRDAWLLRAPGERS